MLSPSSPVLSCLELTFMGVTRSNSGLFSTPGFLSHLWEKEEGAHTHTHKRMEGGEKGIEKERKGREE